MKNVVGVFKSQEAAAGAVEELRALGPPDLNVNLLYPGAPARAHEDVATTEAEAPGPGAALGATIGGAFGASAGLPVLLIPGLGPVVGVGIAAASMLAGIAAGKAVGRRIEEGMDKGLPIDELYLYEDALRQGRSVVIVLANDETEAEAAQAVLAQAGAETVDQGREKSWRGTETPEESHYEVPEPASSVRAK